VALQPTDVNQCPECHRPFVVEYDTDDDDDGSNWVYCPRTPDGGVFDSRVEGMQRCPGKLMLAVPFPSKSIPV